MDEKDADEEGWSTEGIMREIRNNPGFFTKIRGKRRMIRDGMIRTKFKIGDRKLKDIRDLVDYEYNKGGKQDGRLTVEPAKVE
jgi:hypothetical protein